MKRLFALTLLLTFGFSTFAQTLMVDSDNVKISFVADMQKTKGSISGFQAKIALDMDNIEKSNISGFVNVATLETGNKKRDEHLKSADYFEEAKYPTMSFSSTSFSKSGDKIIMKGLLMIKNVEREETITFSYADNMIKGETTIQAANYDIGDYAKKDPNKTNVLISFMIPIK